MRFGNSVWIAGIAGLLTVGCATKEAMLHDQRLIQAFIRDKSKEAEACYREEADQNSEIPSGSLRIRFDQDRKGRLSHPRLMDGFMHSEPVFQCIVKKAKDWETEPPATIGPVDLAFNFKNEGLQTVKDEEFSELMKKHGDSFTECFLKARPNAKRAQIDFKFKKAPSGKVEDLKQVRGFEGSDKIFSCMKNIISSWKLSPQEQPLTASWSYKFEIKEEPRSTRN